jgi:hypothetical protein
MPEARNTFELQVERSIERGVNEKIWRVLAGLSINFIDSDSGLRLDV